VIWLRETLGAKSGAAYSGRSQAVYAALAEARFVIVILLSIPSNVDFIGDFVGSTTGHSPIRAYNAKQNTPQRRRDSNRSRGPAIT